MIDAEEVVRDLLTCTTVLIPNEAIADGLFALGTVVTDHIFNIVGLFGGKA